VSAFGPCRPAESRRAVPWGRDRRSSSCRARVISRSDHGTPSAPVTILASVASLSPLNHAAGFGVRATGTLACFDLVMSRTVPGSLGCRSRSTRVRRSIGEQRKREPLVFRPPMSEQICRPLASVVDHPDLTRVTAKHHKPVAPRSTRLLCDELGPTRPEALDEPGDTPGRTVHLRIFATPHSTGQCALGVLVLERLDSGATPIPCVASSHGFRLVMASDGRSSHHKARSSRDLVLPAHSSGAAVSVDAAVSTPVRPAACVDRASSR